MFVFLFNTISLELISSEASFSILKVFDIFNWNFLKSDFIRLELTEDPEVEERSERMAAEVQVPDFRFRFRFRFRFWSRLRKTAAPTGKRRLPIRRWKAQESFRKLFPKTEWLEFRRSVSEDPAESEFGKLILKFVETWIRWLRPPSKWPEIQSSVKCLYLLVSI